MRQQFFASRFLAHGLESAFVHLDFVRSREHCPSNRILPNRVRYRSFLDDEIVQPGTRGSLRGGESRWSSPDNDQIKRIHFQKTTSPLATNTDGPPTFTSSTAPRSPLTSRLIRLGR